jgi:hypothetical protein
MAGSRTGHNEAKVITRVGFARPAPRPTPRPVLPGAATTRSPVALRVRASPADVPRERPPACLIPRPGLWSPRLRRVRRCRIDDPVPRGHAGGRLGSCVSRQDRAHTDRRAHSRETAERLPGAVPPVSGRLATVLRASLAPQAADPKAADDSDASAAFSCKRGGEPRRRRATRRADLLGDGTRSVWDQGALCIGHQTVYMRVRWCRRGALSSTRRSCAPVTHGATRRPMEARAWISAASAITARVTAK